MSLPPLLPENSRTPAEWMRRAASLVNMVVRRLMDIGATGDRPPNPAVGQQRFNTTTGQPEWWDGASWITW